MCNLKSLYMIRSFALAHYPYDNDGLQWQDLLSIEKDKKIRINRK